MSRPAFWLDCHCLKAKNMVAAECGVNVSQNLFPCLFPTIFPRPFFLATHQHLQSCTLSLKESRGAQPKAANSQHLVQAGAVRRYRRDRGIAAADAAWQLVPSDC